VPKPINPTIGTCECSMKGCTEIADVRRMKNNGLLYLVCPEHGVIRPPGKAHQEYILSHANLPPAPALEEPDPDPVPEPMPDDDPEPTPAPAPDDPEPEPAKPKKGGIFDDWF